MAWDLQNFHITLFLQNYSDVDLGAFCGEGEDRAKEHKQ